MGGSAQPAFSIKEVKMSNWDNYNFDYSSSKSTSSFESTPAGAYHVTLRSMELGTTRKGFPMIKASFSADEIPAPIFVNMQVVRSFDGSTNDNFLISRSNSFLESFCIVSEVHLTTLSAYEQLVSYIAQKAKQTNAKYILTVSYDTGKDGKQYANYALSPCHEMICDFTPSQGYDNPPF